MSFSTVLIISLAAGVVLIIGGGLMMYMANLVKSAYEIKVQINSEVEDRLNKMGDELDKKSKWIKRDLLEEIEKIKANMHTEAQSKVSELTHPFTARLDALDAALKAERAEWVKAVDSDRAAITNIDNRVKNLTKTAKKSESKDAAVPTLDDVAIGGDEPSTAEAPKAPPPPSPSGPAKPTSPPQGSGTATWLPELGNGR
ncbi:hypothetical protein [Magnetospirillum sulfuroxidans]|uniref:Uncharacterized protein n=1 Tax=Magnetospirillum sulfuroxidans TaxID=611300 RepID=A0ABS5I9H6_9PROT|nr:hypothetical protein [Magnetospirillum sulfuroxidans]MBR9970921.1 hypothetical protein [Magnetospirillum sulfuroxidans]